MEKNSFKEYSVLAMISKGEQQQPMKGCLEDSMQTDSGTEEDAHNFGILLSSNLPCSFHVNTRQIWQISDFGCLHVNIRRILAMELDMCNNNITGYSQEVSGFSSTRTRGRLTR